MTAIRNLDDDDVFDLFGKGRSPRARELYFDALRRELSPAAARFWDAHLGYFSGRGWRRSFFYRGSAGTVHKMLCDYARFVRRLGPVLELLLAAPDLETQRALYREHHVRERFASAAMRWMLSRDTLLALCGIPAPQRREMEQHPGGAVGYALDIIETAFTRTRLAENYFWRCVLEGEYTRNCCPEYLQPHNLARLRAGLLDRLRIRTASVTEYLTNEAAGISRFVLLDHMDWLGHHDPADLAEEWSAIFASARTPARVIFRSAARQVRYLDALPVHVRGRTAPLASLVRYDAPRAAALHATDRTCVYGSFYIADLEPQA